VAVRNPDGGVPQALPELEELLLELDDELLELDDELEVPLPVTLMPETV
jgi:hypothetical protein